MIPYAHSLEDRPEDEWEPLVEHLEKVVARAGGFGERLGLGGVGRAYAEALAWLHDAGKFGRPFQRYLRTGKGKVDHSTAGAILARERYRPLGILLAYGIAGHHAGLPDGGDAGEASLLHRCARTDLADLVRREAEAAIGHRLPAALPPPGVPDMFACAFFIRMIFSCLTDADALAAEAFQTPDRSALRGQAPPIAALANRLAGLLDRKTARASAARVNRLRADVLARCRAEAGGKPGFYSLCVPTGGGKTLSSLSFALEHARAQGLERVVYVIPYLSIIEQTARVFRRGIFRCMDGAVLEHHTGYAEPPGEEPAGPDRHKLASENWDAPITVTTAVQFFESLFAARPSRCRKLHNLARSVIVLDEAQMLPLPHLQPCLEALRELVRGYGATVLLCTATQPALLRNAPLSFGLDDVRPIMPDAGALHAVLKRVELERTGLLDDEALADRIADEPRILCVVEQRAHAAALYRRLKERGTNGLFHLSAALCAHDRASVLDQIRKALATRQECRVVATQLVEAGVDVDFPVVMRAMAGLDSIVQCAGRCNREGKLPEPGRVVVFDTPHLLKLPDIERRRFVAKEMLDIAAREGADPLSPCVMERYFARLLQVEADTGDDTFDQARVWRRLVHTRQPDHFPFRSVAADFHLIGDEQVTVITPRSPEAEGWVAALDTAERPGPLARKLQRHTVAIHHRRAAHMLAAETIRQAGLLGQFLVLADRSAYNSVLGLEARDALERTEEENIV